MEFIKPRNIKAAKVDWIISEQSRAIVKYFADYSEYTESDVVDILIKELLKDDKFLEWIQTKRFRKRALAQILLSEDPSELDVEENKVG